MHFTLQNQGYFCYLDRISIEKNWAIKDFDDAEKSNNNVDEISIEIHPTLGHLCQYFHLNIKNFSIEETKENPSTFKTRFIFSARCEEFKSAMNKIHQSALKKFKCMEWQTGKKEIIPGNPQYTLTMSHSFCTVHIHRRVAVSRLDAVRMCEDVTDAAIRKVMRDINYEDRASSYNLCQIEGKDVLIVESFSKEVIDRLDGDLRYLKKQASLS